MTKEEIQDEAGILDLACAQVGVELAQGRIRGVREALRKLTVIVRKLDQIEKAVQAAATTTGSEPSKRKEVEGASEETPVL